MTAAKTTEMTLTEAQMQGGMYISIKNSDMTLSNARTIPYAELYSQRTSVMETPIERIQRAAEDEERHKVSA